MTTTRNLKDHRYAQCHVEIMGETICFVSYRTPVVFIIQKPEGRFVECTGTYSQTTRKQIGWFLKEYAPDLCYHDMKGIVGKGEVKM